MGWVFVQQNFDGVTAPALPAGWTFDTGFTTASTVIFGEWANSLPNSLKYNRFGFRGNATPTNQDNNNGNIAVSGVVYFPSGLISQMQWNLFLRANTRTLSSLGYALQIEPAGSNQDGVGLVKYNNDGGTYMAGGLVGTGQIAANTAYYGQIVANGTALKVYIQRLTDNQWLNSFGTWQTTRITAISTTDNSPILGSGYVGAQAFQNPNEIKPIYIDDFVSDFQFPPFRYKRRYFQPGYKRSRRPFRGRRRRGMVTTDVCIWYQTIDNSQCGAIQACAPDPVDSGAVGKKCRYNNPDPGTVSITGVSNAVLISMESEEQIGLAQWPAGPWTTSLNVSTGNINYTLSKLYVCRIADTCGSVATVGSLVNINQTINPGVYNYTINGVATTGNTSDRWALIWEFTYPINPGALGITFDQIVSVPFCIQIIGVDPITRRKHRFSDLRRPRTAQKGRQRRQSFAALFPPPVTGTAGLDPSLMRRRRKGRFPSKIIVKAPQRHGMKGDSAPARLLAMQATELTVEYITAKESTQEYMTATALLVD